MHKLEVDSVFLNFGNQRILSDVYLKCETGEVVGLLGRNGSGKTSLMNIIYGNLNSNSKSVRFDGIIELKAYQKPSLIAYLPQFNIMPKQLTLSRLFSDFNIDYRAFAKKFPQFENKQSKCFEVLSGGEKRILQLYLIIKSEAQFVMLDEPFSHLSPIQIGIIIDLINEEKRYKGFLITDHMYQYVMGLSDQIYVLTNGKTYQTKDVKEIEFLGYAKL